MRAYVANLVFAINNHKVQNTSDMKQKMLDSNGCSEYKIAIPDAIRDAKIKPQIENAPSLGCIEGRYSWVRTPTTYDATAVTAVPTITSADAGMFIYNMRKKEDVFCMQ